MDFLSVKALHIIFVVTWFAGLFYIVRLFIYHVEAEQKDVSERKILQAQYKIMSQRLWYIITWPSAVLTTILATWLLTLNPSFLEMPWMWVKLTFVTLLYLYHYSCQRIYTQLQNDVIKYSSNQLRLWNEVSTIILFSVVFLVVLKDAVNWIFGVIGIIAFSVTIMIAVKSYKKYRDRKGE